MRGYTIPDNADEQTRMLVEAGVATKIMRYWEESQSFNLRGVGIDDCKFTARWRLDDGGSLSSEPFLQVVIIYHSNHQDETRPLYRVVTVASKGVPWHLAERETLDSDQIALVERLAGPRP